MEFYSIAKGVLHFINTVFMLAGLGVFVLGALVKWYPDFLKSQLPEMLGSVGGPRFDLAAIFQDLATICLVIGAVLLAIGLTGFIGMCAKKQALLLLYAVVLTCIVLAESVVVIMMFVAEDQLISYVQNGMNTTIKDSFRGYNGGDAISIAWNFFQVQFSCCGVVNFRDFHNAPLWTATYVSDSATYSNIALPASCCHNATLFLNGTVHLTDINARNCFVISPGNSSYSEEVSSV
ncbi:leukocyte surface antigen CD53-like [Lingula anatina]|uniref:Tetraspanin n=1 Tax=Lingula anatina TaxID=7574 RepID=A0A1S3GYZ5_LINAN|nr:leukocyte surface antigen CD53-like [Lingula anatina]|eukprot:XP_013378983.1 leukocyte surface antigen CD53-like [Lingula anatina]